MKVAQNVCYFLRCKFVKEQTHCGPHMVLKNLYYFDGKKVLKHWSLSHHFIANGNLIDGLIEKEEFVPNPKVLLSCVT